MNVLITFLVVRFRLVIVIGLAILVWLSSSKLAHVTMAKSSLLQ